MKKLTIYLLIVFSTIILGADNNVISPNQAIGHIGEYKTVKGLVASAKYLSRVKGRPTFMNLDEAYPNQVFTVVIWGDTRDQFPEDPEYYFRNKKITVSGTIIEYKGIAEIIVSHPDQIHLAE
jgi:DNA/RNA endonuclease YhcR with UshA esterase domain